MKNLTQKIRSINYKYFFSELLIVVAGILIAVSLNSWREDNETKTGNSFILNRLRLILNNRLQVLMKSITKTLKVVLQLKTSSLLLVKISALVKTLLKSCLQNLFSGLTGLYLPAEHTGKLFLPEVCKY